MPIIIPVGGVRPISGGGECVQMTPTEKIVMTPILFGIFLGVLFICISLANDNTDSIWARVILYIFGICLSSLILVPLILCW